MAVKLRLMRIGRRNRAFFRINAVEARTPRGGKILEKLGHYDPIEKDSAKQIVLNRERVQFWLDKGAVPSDTVSQILLHQGIKNKYAQEKTTRLAKARAVARAKGKPFNKAEKIALQKQTEEKKAKAEEAKKQKQTKTIEAKPQEKPKAETESETKKQPTDEGKK